MVTAALYAGFAAIAAAFGGVSHRQHREVAEPTSEEFVFYTLDVAFTPYGPEILSFWIPTSVTTGPLSDIRKGDL